MVPTKINVLSRVKRHGSVEVCAEIEVAPSTSSGGSSAGKRRKMSLKMTLYVFTVPLLIGGDLSFCLNFVFVLWYPPVISGIFCFY